MPKLLTQSLHVWTQPAQSISGQGHLSCITVQRFLSSRPSTSTRRATTRGTQRHDAVLCFERLFDCDDPPFQTVANVIDYIRQVLEVGAFYGSCAASPSLRHHEDAMLTDNIGPVLSPRAQHRASRVRRPERRDDGHRPPDHGRLRPYPVPRALLSRRLLAGPTTSAR